MRDDGEAPWYRLLEHTGDLAILVRASSLPALYDAATRALFDVILDVRTIEAREVVPVTVEGAMDREDLLVRFLSELLFLHDARDWLFRHADVETLEEKKIMARVHGEKFDPDRHTVERQVKAVTYHHLLLSEDPEGWSVRLVLDM